MTRLGQIMMRMTTQKLAMEVWDWADIAFPERTDQSMFLKLYSEIGELTERPDDHLEFADVMILLLDYAVRKNIDIEKVVMEKLNINRKRQWKINHLGVMRHEDAQ